MTYKLSSCPLFRAVLVSSLLLAACAQSAIEAVDDDAALSRVEAGASAEPDAADPTPEQDADPPAEDDAGAPPAQDAGGTSEDAAPPDAGAAPDAGAGGSMDAGAVTPEAGAPDSGSPSDAGQDAAVDAAPPRDAAPVDAALPVDTGPPAPTCTAGNYRGTFMGTVVVQVFGVELTTIALMGTITLTAVAEAGTNRFTVANGNVTGADGNGGPVTARVTGTLNCTTGTLENGKLEDGTYTHWFAGAIAFTGSVSGTYTNTPPSGNGTWQTASASTLLRSGMGTWNVALVP